MIILHIGRLADAFFLWGESTKKNTVDEKEGDISFLPYHASIKDLEDALRIAKINDFELFKLRGGHCRVVIWLPVAEDGLLYSNPTVSALPRSSGKFELQPWCVNATKLNCAQLIKFLNRCEDKDILAPGVLLGKDISYFSEVFLLAFNLVVSQQFLPKILKNKTGGIAKWQPFLNRENCAIFHKLAQCMPQILRISCLSVNCNESCPHIESSETVLFEIMSSIIDSSVREANKRRFNGNVYYESTPHDDFINALLMSNDDGTPFNVIEGNKRQLAGLVDQLQSWSKPITVTNNASYNLCFYINEPEKVESDEGDIEPGSDSWTISFFLHSLYDPSLFIAIDKALKSNKQIKNIFARAKFDPHEYLLFAFGQASKLCSYISESLNDAMPSSFVLSDEQLYDFLKNSVPALQGAGFEVIIPSWFTNIAKSDSQIKIRAAVKSSSMKSTGMFSLDDIVNFDWKFSLGDVDVSLNELDALAKLKTPFVKVRGKWMVLDNNSISKAISKLKKRDSASLNEMFKWLLGWKEKEFESITFDGVDNCSWLNSMIQKLEDKQSCEVLSQPDSFKGALRPYQKMGYSWLQFLSQFKLGACLADDMGLGKTIQTLAFIQKNWKREDRQPSLLICPMSVTGNWQNEAQKFTPDLPVMIHHGSGRGKGDVFKKNAYKSAIVVSSYALLHRDFEYFNQINWKNIILDEAQNIKNAETKQAKAAFHLKSDFKVALTGTPVENSIGDLWSIMEFLNPGFLGKKSEFREKIFIPVQVYKDQEVTKTLQRLTAPFILRRVKTDKDIIADLPEKIESKVYCMLTKEQASLYKAVTNEISKALASATRGIERKGLILSALLKFKQICDHPLLFLKDKTSISNRSGKLMRLTEMLEEILVQKEKALIFTQFREMGVILQDHCESVFGKEVLFLHGGVSKKARDGMVDYFQNGQNGPPLFILSLKAGGVGLNLTNANHVFHFDRWWNPAVENQATDRVFRIGQKKNVQVHKFVTRGTLEERIDEMLEQKKALANKIISTSEQWLMKLSNSEIKNLFKLRSDALGE